MDSKEQTQNRLDPNNCNKQKCKTCIFGKSPIDISPERMNEIMGYLSKFEASHICHTTNLTCYGALEFQAKLMHVYGLIKKPTVKSLLNEARNHISTFK